MKVWQHKLCLKDLQIYFQQLTDNIAVFHQLVIHGDIFLSLDTKQYSQIEAMG